MRAKKITMEQADFVATLKYRTTEEGGRKTPAKSGYRPGIKFDFDEMQTSGQQTFIDRDTVLPGDVVDAEIKIVAVDNFEGLLAEGMEFEFSEGPVVIGKGVIKHILNEKLKKPATNPPHEQSFSCAFLPGLDVGG